MSTDTTTTSAWGSFDWNTADTDLDKPARQRLDLAEGQTAHLVVQGWTWVGTDYGPMAVLDAIDAATGNEVSLGCGRTVLRRALERLKVQEGDALAIRYRGMTTPESGSAFHDYALVLAKPVAARRPGETFTASPPPGWDLAVPAVEPVTEGDPADLPF